MYLNNLDEYIQIIVLYVNFIFITISCIVYIGSIKSSLHNAFSMTGLGLLKQFLGLEIEQSDVGNKFSQLKYASDLLLKLKMADCIELSVPCL